MGSKTMDQKAMKENLYAQFADYFRGSELAA